LTLTTSPRISSTYGIKRGHLSKLKRFGCFTFFQNQDRVFYFKYNVLLYSKIKSLLLCLQMNTIVETCL
jgi:hypothetical protein